MATGGILSPESEDAASTQFTREEIAAAARVAHDNHKHLAAHAHAAEGIRNAVEAGADSIEHGSFADDEVLKLMAERGTFLVPTLCVTAAMMRDKAIREALAPHLRRRLVDFDARHCAAIRRAHQLKVPIAMGTDAGTPGNHHGDNAQEVVEMVTRAGLAPADALTASTLNPAKLLRQADRLGSLEPGKCADVIAVSRDPLKDITVLNEVDFVMKDGLVYKHKRRRRRKG